MEHRSPDPPGGRHLLGDRPVARVGFGAMQLERAATGPADVRHAAIALLRRAVELGVEHIDTASFYGDRVVNELLRDALAPYPDGLAIVSKVGAARVPGAQPPLVPAQRPEQLRTGVEDDLRSLGVERVDVVNLRRVDRPPGIVATDDQLVALEDQLAELVALRDSGKIGAIGLSHVSEEQLGRALPAGIACVQNLYGVLDRSDESLLRVCRELEIAWVPFLPLGGAFPGRPHAAQQPELIAAADELGVSPAQVALAWLLGHAPNILLIPGTANPDHLTENLASRELVLSPETVAALDTLVPVGAIDR